MQRVRRLSGHQKLGLLTILGLLALVTLGGSVRVTDSGLACPDWPLCYGQIFPSGEFLSEGWLFEGHQVWLEWTHRLVASVMGVVIVAFVVGAWRWHRDRPWVIWPATLSIVALAIQVLLGGLTVTEELDAGLISAHLGMALVIILLIVGAWLATFVRPSRMAPPPAPRARARRARMTLGVGLGLLALLVLGGYVSGTEAAFFCGTDWPLCNGSLLPEGRNAGIQVAHRYLAAAVGLHLAMTWWVVYRARGGERGLFRLLSLVAALFVGQTLIGAATQWTTLADWSRILHLALGALVWGVAVGMMALAVYRAGWFPSIGQPRGLPAFLPKRFSKQEARSGD